MSDLDVLVRQSRLRNRLLTAQAVQIALRAAAARVVRLSQPGTPERLLTLQAVADETGLRAGAIVKAILLADVERGGR
jgi:hypothetical protein